MVASDTTIATPGQYLGLSIGGEEYAFPILRVKEILPFESLTRVPGTPASIRGVINVRGSVVPVVDLAARFGLPETRLGNRACVVIVELSRDGLPTVMGVLADSVSQVLDLGAADIQAPPHFGARVHVDYLLGMGRTGRGFSMILDVDRVLSATDLEAAARVAPAPEGPAAEIGTGPPA